ncbi:MULTISPECIES: hypothetical protein [Dietzia]|uniref:site-specific DNA-methyltransferase (adenine-specific) n=1 Tax=Dietzia cinnamea TaxID=321318 RepID=A0AAW5Q3A6_9ACTN|nr:MULTISPECIES: hypothetical protein [Dietzia]MBM7231461.1 hypothetical protein [Dietzia cinnamea]MCT2029366.1 hypothetical protein [Dietzia cinnamea]MCT2060235.1 hypothetical protein [Dietzia cinnamea]MCT2074787.1 hypothetical protein [Dietzia cinnamea]MCT2108339.1 hypothetical protein [Dietzia cinnamea]
MAGRARGGRKAQDSTLTQVLQPVVRDLVEDMRERLEDDADRAAVWRARHAGLVEAQRTGATWTDWVEDQLTQAAVGWVLTSVFVRFCEDNDLLGRHKRWISGADADGRARAVDEQERFFSQNLDQGFRGYLRYAFAQLERSPAAASLVGQHAAIHIAEPSDQAAQRLVEFWRQADAENATVWALHDPQLDTRFLGDMYQDLSEYAKKKYALLQTPEFVEEFILDRTLTPALGSVVLAVPGLRMMGALRRWILRSLTRRAVRATSCSGRLADCWTIGDRMSRDLIRQSMPGSL